ncbi:MAG: hypothetical protein JWM47_1053 [Acidimicrobiales bacterium]|nr:hypothetical protein [Acidimicrobiales bacterium]
MLLSLAGLAVVWTMAALYLANQARADVTEGREGLEAVREGATPSSLLQPHVTTDLAQADRDFASARAGLRSPILAPLRVLPVVGRHLRAADKVVATSQGATRLASAAVRDLHEIEGRDLAAGPQRLRAVEDLGRVITRTRLGLAELDPGSPDALVGALGDAVVELAEERDETVANLGTAGRVTTAVAQVLRGPTPYLLIGANNAEMRAGSGMYLSAATLGFDDGRLDLGEVRPTEQLVLPPGQVPVKGNLAVNWSWLDGGRDLRNMGLSADFPQSAALAAANWARVPGGAQVGGVIVVDVDALRGLLGVVGPVDVGGVHYTADNVRGELLRKQYERFGADRDARRDQLGEVARVVFERIEAGSFELDRLATALTDAVVRRHLLVWSADEGVQGALATAGADGHLRSDSLSVALINRGAEKLDSYIDTSARLDSSERADGRIVVTIRYRIENGAPDSGPSYLLGPNIGGLEEGEHRGIAVVNLPAGTTDVELEGATATLLGTDGGPTLVIAGSLDLPRHRSTEVTVTGVLPEGMRSVVLEPSARITRTLWTVDGERFEIDRRRTLHFGE